VPAPTCTEDNLREADAILDRGLPQDAPEDIRQILSSSVLASRSMGEVVQGDGRLDVAA
jgi:hypothetical protein